MILWWCVQYLSAETPPLNATPWAPNPGPNDGTLDPGGPKNRVKTLMVADTDTAVVMLVMPWRRWWWWWWRCRGRGGGVGDAGWKVPRGSDVQRPRDPEASSNENGSKFFFSLISFFQFFSIFVIFIISKNHLFWPNFSILWFLRNWLNYNN